jgi:hypothetical protein
MVRQVSAAARGGAGAYVLQPEPCEQHGSLPRLFDAQQGRGRQSTSWETFEGLHEVYVVGSSVRFHVLEVDITDIDVLS